MSHLRYCNSYYDPNMGSYLIEYRGNFKEQIDKVSYACGDIFTERIGVVSVKPENIDQLLIDVPAIVFFDFRTMFVLQQTSPSNVDNINNIKINPYLNLTGRGVLIGIVDTGINYLNKEFIREDGTSRIASIWDQTIENGNDESVYIGKTYSNEQINNAIKANENNQDPYAIVPSKDDIGHGTKIAGIIGARGYNNQFQGIASDSDFVIVKLFESPYYKRILQENNVKYTPVYNSTVIVAGVQYLRKKSAEMQKPMVIYLGVGSSEGSHDGKNLISRYMTSIGGIRGLCLVAGVGNEGDSQGHVTRYIKNVGDIQPVELKIPKEMKYFIFYIWVQRPNRAALNVISPTGESSKLIELKTGKSEEIKFIFLDTSMIVRYYSPEHFTGHEVIEVVFNNIKPGIWRFELVGEYITNGRFDIWLPPKSTLPENTVFLESNPFNTLTIPSSALNIITVSYYGDNKALIAESGKGFNTNNILKPDIATLGTNILTTEVSGSVATISGSSAATAIVAGVCTLLLQWGIVDGNDKTMYSKKIRTYLIYGAYRNPIYNFPNKETGFGELDILSTFDVISRSYRRGNTDNIIRRITEKNMKRNNKNDNFKEYYINKLFIRIPLAKNRRILDDKRS